ncbi:hypothetical protein SOCEGT47_019660 [Sorangium cellulosum]|uniref:Outer membrane protein beta-barrel domain-containing protein n=1 Tax=Sorangium cellulosum TaxID=56 RepID=A0A4V0ND54_SORCE|nr:hypothetical protein [Sorangium cellulosum]AUX21482.1 hypothetical protein SOCEGT47_019660 [Sorangium cellulosum]
MLRHALPLLVAWTCGCAPALSTLQPAHVAPKGHVQAELGMDVSIPTGTLASVVDAGAVLADVAASRELSEGERRTLFEAGGALALNPPSVTPHLGIGYTALDAWEINLRYSVSALRLGTRYQLLKGDEHGVDLTAGVGFGYYVMGFPVGNLLDLVELTDFTRWQIDLPLQIGKAGTWYRVWSGPRLMLTSFGTELVMNLPAFTGYGGEREIASFSGTGLYLGGQAGVALGYKHVFFGFELTLAQLFSTGELAALGKPVAEIDLDSLIVYPTLGLMGEF